MEKIITIGDKEVPFKATASTIRRYRQKTGRDLLADMQSISASMSSTAGLSSANLQAFEDVAYVMAQQADPTIPADPDEWLDQFDMFSIYQVLPQLVELWGLSMETIAEPANKKK